LTNSDDPYAPMGGMIATELWYFVNRRLAGSAKLNGSTQLQPGEPLSSRDGIRWVSYADRDVPKYWSQNSALLRKFEEASDDDPGSRQHQDFEGVRGQFFMTSSRPVPILLFDDNALDGEAVLGIAFRVTDNTIEFSVPDNPGATYQATLSTDGLVPVDLTLYNGLPRHVTHLMTLMYAGMVQDDKLAALRLQVVDHSIGKGEWPEPTLHMKDAELDTGKVFLDDALQHWWECAGCKDDGFHPPNLPASATHVQLFRFGNANGGAWEGLTTPKTSADFSNTVFPAGINTRSTGNLILLPIATTGGEGGAWLDWRTVTYRKLQLTSAPATVELAGRQTVTFTVTPDVAPPTGTRYSWVLITENNRDSVETAGPSRAMDLAAGTVGTLRINAHEPGSNRIISHVDVPISAGAAPYWVITSISDQDQALNDDQNGLGGDAFDRIVRMIAVPQSGLIGVTQNGGVSEFFLRVRPNGTWTSTEPCCPPLFAPTDSKEILGVTPAIVHTFGAFFNQYQTSSWSQTTTDLTTGTMTGQYAPGSINYPISGGGTQNGPDYAVRITATRSGNTLTGVITLTNIFFSDDGQGLTAGDLNDFRFPFTAVRLK
jgi:hypothetical protein